MADDDPMQQLRTLSVPADRPLVGIIVRENGDEVVRLFAESEDAEPADDGAIEDALSLAGAWSDLVWEDVAAALDRIRHESRPSPPLSL